MRHIAIALLLAACNSKPAGPSELELAVARVRKESPPAIAYYDIVRAYEANEVAADAKYKGKVLHVIGQVAAVTREDDLVVVHVGGPHADREVLCLAAGVPPAQYEVQPAELTPGDGVDLYGIGSGVRAGAPILDACVVWR